jgi:hypothetical protein
MRNILLILALTLCMLPIASVGAQQANNRLAPEMFKDEEVRCFDGNEMSDMFKDVPIQSWAYSSMERLRYQNIVIGYPDGYFRGKRTLTRYEFAVALDRASRSLSSTISYKIATPTLLLALWNITELEFLVNEFKVEIKDLGTDPKAITTNLKAVRALIALALLRPNPLPDQSTTFIGAIAEHAHGLGYREIPKNTSDIIPSPPIGPRSPPSFITISIDTPLFPKTNFSKPTSGRVCGMPGLPYSATNGDFSKIDLLHGGYKQIRPQK